MDPLKVSLYSIALREGTITTTCQPPHVVQVTTFKTATWYTIWNSVCTHSINPYFELYTQCKTLENGDDAEVNGIMGIIKPKGIDTVIMNLE